MTDPAALTAIDAVRAIREGRLSAMALMGACLERVARREPTLHAFAHLDSSACLSAARKADERARRGQWGPLLGLPLGVKDVLDVEGMPSGYGSPVWAGYSPWTDAACVASARAAGGVVMGKTVTTEFATRKPGPTVNPVDAAHTPGGSSSGSAAGVAAGFFPLAFATQTAGSIVRPAAFCGVVGYMPSHGMLHRAGMKVMSESLDTIGAVARTVADCALLVGACAGRDLGDPDTRPGRPPRLALCLGPTAHLAAVETQDLMERVAAAAGRAGASVVRLNLPSEVTAACDAQPVVMNAESAQALAWEMTRRRSQLSDLLLERLDDPRLTPEALDAGRAAMVTARRAFALTFTAAGVDAVLTPSAPGEAPLGLAWTGDPAFNALWTALHAACVTVPAGTGPRGLPLGVQVVTPNGGDRQALAWAAWLQDALDR